MFVYQIWGQWKMKICPNFHTQLVSYQLQNPFLSNVSFLPPLKTENQRFYIFTRRVKKLKPERNGLKSNKFPYFTKGLILVSLISSFRKEERRSFRYHKSILESSWFPINSSESCFKVSEYTLKQIENIHESVVIYMFLLPFLERTDNNYWLV